MRRVVRPASSLTCNYLTYACRNTFTHNHDMLFIPSISPGYDDLKIRPWNSEMVVNRYNDKVEDGQEAKIFFYTTRCESVRTELSEYPPKLVFINSFNDWILGTQIEPATPVTIPPLEQCDPSRKGNRMCKRLQSQLRINGKYFGYLGEEPTTDYHDATIVSELSNEASVDDDYFYNITNDRLETSAAFHYLKLTKRCLETVFAGN